MQSSFLYHAYGLQKLECNRTDYKGNQIILHVHHRDREFVCPKCGKRHIVKNGYRTRSFLGLPIGRKQSIIKMKVQRYICRDCGHDWQEHITFTTGNRSYTHRFAKYVVDLLRMGTIQDVARWAGVSWDTVKEIHSIYLKRHYSPPLLKGVKNIGIDEFAVRKGHVYKTIVVDLDTGRILYVGDGKGVDSLKGFWKKAKRLDVKIEHVATDLSTAFIASVMENVPNATLVFDHFHVVKLMNEAVDDVRRAQYAIETDINKRKVIKGTRYLLLRSGKDTFDSEYKNRLENALALNEPLSKAYYLKEQLAEVWRQSDKIAAEQMLQEWYKQVMDSKIPRLIKTANTIMAHRTGILAWYDCRISTAKVEGINNKIKVMKRQAYGFRDDDYFRLRLFALHDCRITQNVG